MKSRKRNLNNCIEMLTFIWLKWLKNYLEIINESNSSEQKKIATIRCERIQKFRRELITEINSIFQEKII